MIKHTSEKQNLYMRPLIAWPTIGIFCISFVGWVLSILIGTGYIMPFGIHAFDIGYLIANIMKNSTLLIKWFISVLYGTEHIIPTWFYTINIQSFYNNIEEYLNVLVSFIVGIFCMVLSSTCSYAMFTVAHDAIHGSVSKNRNLNNVIGYISQFWLGPTSNWYGLKKNHLLHHLNTNDPDFDPDFWCAENGPGGKKLMVFRWITLDFVYWYYFFPILIKESKLAKVKFIGYEMMIIGLIIFCIKHGYFFFLLQYWIIPARFAILILSYAFDYLPHAPHTIKRSDNMYGTTAYISVPWYLEPLIRLLIFYQNYHVVHHICPSVPFYKYKKLWNLKKDNLINNRKIPIKRLLTIMGKEDLKLL